MTVDLNVAPCTAAGLGWPYDQGGSVRYDFSPASDVCFNDWKIWKSQSYRTPPPRCLGLTTMVFSQRFIHWCCCRTSFRQRSSRSERGTESGSLSMGTFLICKSSWTSTVVISKLCCKLYPSWINGYKKWINVEKIKEKEGGIRLRL